MLISTNLLEKSLFQATWSQTAQTSPRSRSCKAPRNIQAGSQRQY